MKKSTKIILAVVVVGVIALVAVGIVRRGQKKGVEVEIGTVANETLVSRVAANGTIDAKRKVDLSANVMGQIVNLAVREGQQVEQGEFLLQIDQARLAADAAGAQASMQALVSDLESARASARESQLALQRSRSSFEAGVIPRAELDRAEAAHQSASANVSSLQRRIEQARAGLASARDSLAKTTMRAPISGVVTALPVEEGEVAVIGTMNNPGTRLLTISDMSVVEAVMEVDETDVPNVKVGQKAEVSIDAYPGRTFTGTVTEVASSPRAGVGGNEAINFEVKIQLDSPPDVIRPGFSASADIITGVAPNVTAIPIQALVIRETPAENAQPAVQASAGTSTDATDVMARRKPQEEEGVYLFDEASKTVKFQRVETGLTGETSVQITSGLKPGDKIVIGPFRALREIEDGDVVRVSVPARADADQAEKN